MEPTQQHPRRVERTSDETRSTARRETTEQGTPRRNFERVIDCTGGGKASRQMHAAGRHAPRRGER